MDKSAMLAEFEWALRNKQQAPNTIRGHISRSRIILDVKTSAWSEQEAKEWLLKATRQHSYATSTFNKWVQTFNALNDIFAWNWSSRLKTVKENNKSPEMLSLEELKQFYDLQTQEKYDVIIRLAISTGARPSEILTLKRYEVDLSRKIITLNYTKTKHKRILIIQDFLVDQIHNYIQNNNIRQNDYMFYYRNKAQSLNIKSLEKEFERRLEILGISKRITPYSMRHSYCTRMASRINLWTLKELAGHIKSSTTEKYIHNNEFMLRHAAEQDFLFDDLRDWSKQMQDLIKQINKLAENDTAQLDPVKLAEAVLCLRQAVKT